jgi:hypothetical protein
MKTQDLARILYPLATAFWVLLLISPIIVLFANGFEKDSLVDPFTNVAVPSEVPIYGLMAIAGVGLIPLFIMAYVIWCFARVFHVMRTGQLISHPIAKWLHRIGIGFLAGAVASALIYPLQVLVLTSFNPPGQHAVAIAFGSEEIIFTLVGLMIYVLGHAVEEATALATENKAFI